MGKKYIDKATLDSLACCIARDDVWYGIEPKAISRHHKCHAKQHVSQPLVPIIDVANANMQAIYHNHKIFNYIIEVKQSEIDRITGAMDKYETQMMELLNKYRATELPPDETRLLANFDRQWPPYLIKQQRK